VRKDDKPRDRYRPETRSSPFDDCIMRRAVEDVTPGRYRLFGNNCQDWASAVRRRYGELLDDPAVQEECGCVDD